MLGDFTYCNPTRLHFGRNALDFLPGELTKCGKTVLLVYGGGSIKKTGLYDKILAILRETGKTVVEDAGVMPNPTLDKLREGARLARENNVDLILSVGGGSCCDYSKGVSAAAWCEEDPWEKFYQRMEEPSNRLIPMGCVLTMVGTGSEMNGGSVITNTATKQKVSKIFGDALFPKFAILNPELTYTLPHEEILRASMG